jgi:predicted kinase
MSEDSLILLRGLPGSGKSTLASILSEDKKYPVFSIDDYFTDENGKYEFDPYKNHLAYKQCESLTAEAMKANIPKIFVHNTFTIDWEIEPYFKLANQFNYRIFVLTVENHHGKKNIHNIPEEHLEKMASKYKVKLL